MRTTKRPPAYRPRSWPRQWQQSSARRIRRADSARHCARLPLVPTRRVPVPRRRRSVQRSYAFERRALRETARKLLRGRHASPSRARWPVRARCASRVAGTLTRRRSRRVPDGGSSAGRRRQSADPSAHAPSASGNRGFGRSRRSAIQASRCLAPPRGTRPRHARSSCERCDHSRPAAARASR